MVLVGQKEELLRLDGIGHVAVVVDAARQVPASHTPCIQAQRQPSPAPHASASAAPPTLAPLCRHSKRQERALACACFAPSIHTPHHTTKY